MACSRAAWFSLLLVVAISTCSNVLWAQSPLSDDTFAVAGDNSNHGSQGLLAIQAPNVTTYIRFDLSYLPSGITGKSVTKATVSLYVTAVQSPGSFDVTRVDAPWTEAVLTGSNAPALGSHVSPRVEIGSSDLGHFVVFDVTSVVRNWLDHVYPNYGIALLPHGGISVAFDSKESTTTSHAPQLSLLLCSMDCTGGKVDEHSSGSVTNEVEITAGSLAATGTVAQDAYTRVKQSVYANGVLAVDTAVAARINGVLVVDGVKYPKSAAGIQKAINAAQQAGGGKVVIPPTPGAPINMAGTAISVYSNVCVEGAGIGVTELRWTSNGYGFLFKGTERTCLRDVTISFTTAAAESSGIRIDSNDVASFRYNTIENVEINFPQPTGTSLAGRGIYATSSSTTATTNVLNTFRNIFVNRANQAISCQGCEGNYWQVMGQFLGGMKGTALADWSGLEADEVADLRLEAGTGNASNLTCVRIRNDWGTGTHNLMRVTCDMWSGQGQAVQDEAGYNNWIIEKVGAPSLGVIPATSEYRTEEGGGNGRFDSLAAQKGPNYLGNFNYFLDLPIYPDNAAATAAGLKAGRMYRTATGQLMVVY